MLTCPMCKKALAEKTRECPRCRADLSLLTDYVDHLQDRLCRAEALTRDGELGQAVWTYLEVLEIDPDNGRARDQVARVATAVRQFDRVSPSRLWLRRLRRRARFRQWLMSWENLQPIPAWYRWGLVILLLFIAFGVGYEMGRERARRLPDTPEKVLELGD